MTKAASKAERKDSAENLGFFGRIVRFIHEIFAELKKVQRPTREELGQMFSTVIIFVAVIMIFVGVIDTLSARLAFWVFA